VAKPLTRAQLEDRAALETDVMLILSNGMLKPQERCDAILHSIASGIAARNAPPVEPTKDDTEDRDDKTSESDKDTDNSAPDDSTRSDDDMKDALMRAKMRMLSR
jgi:hypothetical protein